MLVRALRLLAIVVLAAASFAQDRSNPEVDPLWNALDCQEAKTPVTITGTVLLPSGLPAEGAVVVSSAGGMARVGDDGSFRLELSVASSARAVQVTAVGAGAANLVATRQVVGLAAGALVSTGPMTMQVTTGCQPAWLPTFGPAMGTNYDITALGVFDDGTGPALYAGGPFTRAGSTTALHIAKWDGVRWTSPGFNLFGYLAQEVVPHAMTTFDDGSGPALYIAGEFAYTATATVNGIFKWNGTTVVPLGTGVSGFNGPKVWALQVFDDGSGPSLYVGGEFSSAGGITAQGIAKWNGSGWSALPSVIAGTVRALAVFDDGSGPALFAGGTITAAGGTAANRIAKWNGTAWSQLSGGVTSGGGYSIVNSLCTYDDGSGMALFAGGIFTTAGGAAANNVAKWDGSAWSNMSGGVTMPSPFPVVYAMQVYDAGSGPGLFVSGAFTFAGGVPVSHVARWSASGWEDVGGGVNFQVEALTVFDSGSGPRLFAGGSFTTCGGVAGNHIGSWNGSNWAALGGGLNSSILAMTTFDDGDGPALFAGGAALTAGGIEINYIGKYRQGGWSPVDTGFNGYVNALQSFDDGTGPALYAGGAFSLAGNTPVNCVAKWDGAHWSSLAGGMSSSTYYPTVTSLAVFDDGTGSALYACGYFTAAGGVPAFCIAKWSGVAWSPLGNGLSTFGPPPSSAMAVFNDGQGAQLYVAGTVLLSSGSYANNIAKWNGTTWSAVGGGTNGQLYALRVFDDGSGPALYAGGDFTLAGGAPAAYIARWNGSAWSQLGSGMNARVLALGSFDDGGGEKLYAGGGFFTAGGLAASGIARWNGSAWSPLGAGAFSVLCLGVYDDGACTGPSLFAGGNFLAAPDSGDAFLARWTCTQPSLSSGCVSEFCVADGVIANCPCGNDVREATGCGNSAGHGSGLSTTGTASITSDTLVLHVAGVPSSVLSIFVQGSTVGAPVLFGDGLRCVGGSLKRLYTKTAIGTSATAPGSGDLSITARSAALSDPLLAGSVRYLQTYYRDPVQGHCTAPQGSNFNVSSGLAVTWGP